MLRPRSSRPSRADAEGRSRFGISPKRAAFAGIFAVTGLGLLSVGATLPVIPRYVQGPIGGGDFSVGLVTGAFAITGLACRPLAGNLADQRGRRPVVILGAILTAIAGALYFIPAGVPGLVVARLFLGAGEGMVYTAGSAWVVDLAPPERRGRIIGLYGLAIWGGLTVGPLIGELILRASSFEMVWAFAMAAPLLGAVIAWRIPDSFSNAEPDPIEARTLIERKSLLPGLGLALGTMGYAAVAAFLVLHLDERGIGHGAEVFAAFAATVVLARILGGWLPDRFGPVPCIIGAGVVESTGLIAIMLAESLPVAIAGALAMGAAFSLLLPSLALLVLDRVPEERRGAAMGTFTAFFDLGVGLGAPAAGLAAAVGGYTAAFGFAAVAAAAL
ncbi:MAG: MFS transporter, partial [Actinomycetota bacterium]|nr:MFS transporter [Actinomycetota bacterium]